MFYEHFPQCEARNSLSTQRHRKNSHRALKAIVGEGFSVEPFKLGPDFIDTVYATLKELLGKNSMTPGARTSAVTWAIEEKNYSQPALVR